MVVVPKPNGTVRICVDLKPLNENVLREVYPMPKVGVTLAQLNSPILSIRCSSSFTLSQRGIGTFPGVKREKGCVSGLSLMVTLP